MTHPPGLPAIDAEQVLAHDPFVRGLARQLVRDEHAADDLVQQTWVAALGQPVPPTSLRGWLAAVLRRLALRRHRADRRELARQQTAAQPELVPSTATIVQREAIRAAVVRAVLGLGEPYRTVVLLRWFENLPPRAIARSLDCPVETVRTRLKRAYAELRQQLDRDAAGDRRAWCALLLPFAGPPGLAAAAAGAWSSLLTGALLMSMATRVTVVGVLLTGLLAGVFWLGGGAPAEPPPSGTDSPTTPPATSGVGEASAGQPTSAGEAMDQAADAQRVEVAGAATGSLLVRVLHSDQSPAPEVLVELLRSGSDDLFELPRARTDERGEARFTDLAPGRIAPFARRPDSQGNVRCEIAAGQEATATLVLERGIDARGIVVDAAGAPVAGAEVLAADWGGGEATVLGRTAADGTFALLSVSTHCHLGARAPGHCASSMHTITASEGATVELRIVLARPGASVRGVVLGPRDEPVAGAIVRVGSTEQDNHKLPDGTQAMAPRPVVVHTDAAGRFAAASLPAGRLPVAVRARELAPWLGEVEVSAGGIEELTVRLLPGVVLIGIVRDAAGAGVANAHIRVGEWGQLGRQRRRTDSTGAFRLVGLPVGELKVSADHDTLGNAETRLQGLPGETLRWEPTLDAGLQLRGRVLDDDGKPVANVMLEARRERSSKGESWWAHEVSDAEGRFTLKNCEPGVPIRIDVRRHMMNEVLLRQVLPGSEELVVRLPKAQWTRIKGTVLDPEGKPLPNVEVTTSMTGSGGDMNTVDPASGAFDVGPYPPGEFTLSLEAGGFAPIRVQKKLAPDEVWDLGTVRFQRGGSLVVNLVAPGAEPLAEPWVSVYDRHGLWCGNVEVAGGQGRIGPFAPGDYVLQIRGKNFAALQQPFAIRVDVETRIDVPLQAGVAVELRFPLPAGAPADGTPVEVRTRDGTVVLRVSAWPREGDPELRTVLRPGTYEVQATGPRFAGAGTFEVVAPGPVQARIPLALR